jgi:uncharacterized membrane protein YphA (DoxX/SURF4 family)
MNVAAATLARLRGCAWIWMLGRWALGGALLYLGLSKALHPVDFLKVLRQYDLVETQRLLSLVAAVLPWFEVFCGLLLLTGVAVRGAAILALSMLVPFTVLVAHRALGIHQAEAIPFCAIRFDCGCGAGEVNICGKILENGFLILLAASLLIVRVDRWCWRHDLVKSR